MKPDITQAGSAEIMGEGFWISRVVRFFKSWLHGGDRPPIRIRNGGSVHVRTAVGEFAAEPKHWRVHQETETPVKGLRVEVLAEGKTLRRLTGTFVRIVYRANGQERHLVVWVRRPCCLPWKGEAYVRTSSPGVLDRGSELVLDDKAATTLVSVSVGRFAADSHAETHACD